MQMREDTPASQMMLHVLATGMAPNIMLVWSSCAIGLGVICFGRWS